MSINKAIIIGHLGKDPEIRHTNAGKRIASLSVATSETWKDNSGGKQEKTEWHKVVIFSDALAGIVEKYAKKGSKVYIEGKIATRKWQDSNGQDRYSTEIILQGYDTKFELLDRKDADTTTGTDYQAAKDGWDDKAQTSTDFDDEIPF